MTSSSDFEGCSGTVSSVVVASLGFASSLANRRWSTGEIHCCLEAGEDFLMVVNVLGLVTKEVEGVEDKALSAVRRRRYLSQSVELRDT